MNDDFYIDDLLDSLKKDVVMERYYPLIDCKEELKTIITKAGAVRKSQLTDNLINGIEKQLGKEISILFVRYIHIYDFNKSKLNDIKEFVGTKEYEILASLLRLPGVRSLRALLYYNSGITLEILAKESTENIRSLIKNYIQCENRKEIVPQPKEVNCHREVAKMILNTSNMQSY